MVCSHINAAQMDPISKSDFKAHALEVLREVEETGKPRIITNCGRPTLEIRKLRQNQASPLEVLKGSVLKYKGATLPVDDDDWDLE